MTIVCSSKKIHCSLVNYFDKSIFLHQGRVFFDGDESLMKNYLNEIGVNIDHTIPN